MRHTDPEYRREEDDTCVVCGITCEEADDEEGCGWAGPSLCGKCCRALNFDEGVYDSLSPVATECLYDWLGDLVAGGPAMQEAFERNLPFAIMLYERGAHFDEADARQAFNGIAKRYLELRAIPPSKRDWYDDPTQILGDIFSDEWRAVRKLILTAHRIRKKHNINLL